MNSKTSSNRVAPSNQARKNGLSVSKRESLFPSSWGEENKKEKSNDNLVNDKAKPFSNSSDVYVVSRQEIEDLVPHLPVVSSTISKSYGANQAHDNPAYLYSESICQDSCPSSITDNEASFIKKHCARVTLLRQQYSWDCGVTCIMMILPKRERQYLADNLQQVALEENFHNSTWSIDLAYLLYRFGIQFRYYTITLGVDHGLSKEKFYQTAISKDELRVVDRFERASELGLVVEKRSVSLMQIKEHLKNCLPIIVLTNAHLLQCRLCSFSETRARIRDCFAVACDVPYQGHFVVLVGCDENSGLIYYANPSVGKKVCCCTFEHMEDARLSYGTDEDIIFIDRDR